LSAATDFDFGNYPQLSALRDLFRSHYRFSRDIVDRSIAAFGDAWAADFESLLQTMFPTPDVLAPVAKGYSTFAMEAMRLQARFEKERAYKNKTYAEAAAEVYFNEQHMNSEYLPGLLISHYLWPHHYRQLEFFDVAFAAPMRRSKATSFVEVGVGTGLYSRRLLQALPNCAGLGLDISPSSKAFAERHVAAFGMNDRYRVELRDVIQTPMETTVDRLVCVEVLEHLENPPEFLAALRRLLAPGGRGFITAAINAAHTDHIYLYRSASEVEAQLSQAGFFVEQSFVGTAYKPSAEDVPVPQAAAFVVY
jgi:2-polyprenyl-3-methyl-5-hydroxy-6-metoxy-1,4-benzoquinol methylase